MSSLPYRTQHPELERLLDKLRLKIQGYLLFHGIALTLLALCLGFFATLGFDWVHFQIRKLELPVLIRMLMAAVMAGAIAWVLANQVVLRMLKSKKSSALALILERRFPELDDRLITAVEMQANDQTQNTPLTNSMLDLTIQDVSRSADQLNISDVFDWKPLIQSWLAALVLLFGVGLVAGAMPQSFERWTRAFVHFDKIYWLRQTALEVVVLAEPGDRMRPFVEGVYKHPRGADLKLLVSVPESENGMGNPWVVPEDVEIDYTFLTTKGGGVKSLARRGERQFQFKMGAVLDDLEFWISGNDFVNRTPYRIEVVAPPKADSIVLTCAYPDYTNLNTITDSTVQLEERKLQGKQIRIPEETAFVLTLNANKPLENLIVQAGPYELTLGRDPATVSGEEQKTAPEEVQQRLLQQDGSYGPIQELDSSLTNAFIDSTRQQIQLPFVLSKKSAEHLADRVLHLPELLGSPWVLPPDSDVKIYLEDHDGIISAEPIRFSILGIADQPPNIETELTGIGSSITSKAMIPVKGMVADDYGISKTRFDFKVDDETEFRLRPLKNPPNSDRDISNLGYVLEHPLQENEQTEYERFNVSPLDLTPGQTLVLTVYALDNDMLNGPHENRGRNYSFTIVTEEELLAILHDREVNLRRQFEQIISEVERTREDLLDHRDVAQKLKQLPEESEDREELVIKVGNAAERAKHQIGKNRTETTAVRESFKRILDELRNNRIHSQEQNKRIESLILDPLTRITEQSFENADIAVGLFSQANEAGNDPLPAIDQTTDALSTILRQMRLVLAEISDLAEFHEALQELRNLIQEEAELKKQTEEKQQEDLKKLKDSLKKLGI